MDSKDASRYLIDPLTAPEPSAETGPGSHFDPVYTSAPKNGYTTPPTASASPKDVSAAHIREQSTGGSNNPFRAHMTGESSRRRSTSIKDGSPVHVRQSSRDYPSPPSSTSPRREKLPAYREDAFGGYTDQPKRRSVDHARSGTDQPAAAARRRRGSSLVERFPGDKSHQPLEMLKKDAKAAHRSPHLKKHHLPGADTVDRLDVVTGPYHHEGPYDAALLARNTSFVSSPVAAVEHSNEEALKATPRENIRDAVERHHPLDGVAVIPPGMEDKWGRRYEYEEGADLMREPDAEGGAYRRWPGVDYRPEDLKGKGEPSFSLDRALKAHTIHERDFDGHAGIEMSDRANTNTNTNTNHRATGRTTGRDGTPFEDPGDAEVIAGGSARYADLRHQADVAALEAHGDDAQPTWAGRRSLDGLKRRIGSLRRNKGRADN
ncbi:hypothetical protein B0A49_06232 [Cryomyces minteri]|uniref:Pal1 cell morphology protein n=1 Tax=Cryomyces minteri TaxID=331657 RepID=A0A4U0X7I6_9PEZI|nr:hypothetical protein B0A49_06232 [Cryomyces minteri]